MNYQEKYIKYKTKYLELAKQIKNTIQKGGNLRPIKIRVPSIDDKIQPQESLGCGRHALNNLFRNPNITSQYDALFIKGDQNDLLNLDIQRPDKNISLFSICKYIFPAKENFCNDNENYDTSILQFALLYAGYQVDETGYKKNNENPIKELENIEIIICKSIDSIGGIVNYGDNHWISIVKNIENNKWYSYDSIGSEKTEFNNFEEYFTKNKDKITQILFIKIPIDAEKKIKLITNIELNDFAKTNKLVTPIFADEDKIGKYKEAVEIFLNFDETKKDEVKKNFKKQEYVVEFFKLFFKKFKILLEKYKSIDFSNKNELRNFKKSNLYFTRQYNILLNVLLSKINDDSPLKNLLLIDKDLKLIYTSASYENAKKDIFQPGDLIPSSNKSGYRLHLNNKLGKKEGYSFFETPEELLSMIKACIDSSIWNDLSFKNRKKYSIEDDFLFEGIKIFDFEARLRIKFFSTGRYLESDDSGIKHILCNGSPPNLKKKYDNLEYQEKFLLYYEFKDLVVKRIHQIIRDNFNNPDCKYTHIRCCRIDPLCNIESLTYKHGYNGTNSNFECPECTMQICRHGCAKPYHGETPCGLLDDEQTNLVINAETKLCGHCHARIYKFEGCNHMVCRCGTHFCYICEKVLWIPGDNERDKGLNVNQHYVRELGGNCNQFD
jgi:hypothetical protein